MQMLVDKIPGLEWQTETVVVDFEMAFLSACKAVLPNIQFVLCFFHLAQRIQRNCDRLGLRQALKQDLKLRTRMKMLKALAFVPVEDVAVCFDLMCAKFNWGKLSKVVNYFEATYLGNIRRTGTGLRRAAADYSPKFWNQFERTKSGLARTNNQVEAWNKAFATAMKTKHPPLWKLVKHIQREINHVKSKQLHLKQGQFKPRHYKKNLKMSEKIRNITQNYHLFDDKIEYLGTVATFLSSK